MKKFLIAILILFLNFKIASAEENFNLDFETARTDFICALSSMSAYSDDSNIFLRSMLNSRGWKISAITTKNSRANVKAYLIEKNSTADKKIKILVIAGTEEIKDVEVDFRIGRVGLQSDEIGEDKIFVHRGFRDYTDVALSGGVKEYLLEDLKNNPGETLYITGHSLGGAVALMTAVRLCASGANMNQIKVVTFGAPAVGNQNFADAYQDKIDLRRFSVKGDIIKKSLQALGYVHFGKFLEYKPIKSGNLNSHAMSLYLEGAIKNYYNSGGFEKFMDIDDKNKIDTKIYVAPVKILQKSFSEEEEKYILPMLRDGLNSRLTNLVFAEPKFIKVKKSEQFSYDVTEFLETARKQGCKFILVQNLQKKSVRESRDNEMRVDLDEMIFDMEGKLLSMQTAGATTENFTVIEAAAFAQESLRETREQFFTAK